mmetsp:Transcript_21312/g.64911  ORF Transcript_21312/g.64911 Transcript_21312/m.64911 type:complete len:217 (+) Transcript_21312:327-977(+)
MLTHAHTTLGKSRCSSWARSSARRCRTGSTASPPSRRSGDFRLPPLGALVSGVQGRDWRRWVGGGMDRVRRSRSRGGRATGNGHRSQVAHETWGGGSRVGWKLRCGRGREGRRRAGDASQKTIAFVPARNPQNFPSRARPSPRASLSFSIFVVVHVDVTLVLSSLGRPVGAGGLYLLFFGLMIIVMRLPSCLGPPSAVPISSTSAANFLRRSRPRS